LGCINRPSQCTAEPQVKLLPPKPFDALVIPSRRDHKGTGDIIVELLRHHGDRTPWCRLHNRDEVRVAMPKGPLVEGIDSLYGPG